jgi:hypothetical protein
LSRGVTVKLFLVDGKPEGLKIVEKSNWTGIGIMCSRVQYPEVQHRSEFDGPGVYVLVGPGDTGSQQAIYIGEADVARTRLNQHVKGTDFWASLILFTSKDANLNKDHVRYLESRLVRIARDAKRAQIQNGNIPAAPQLSEADRADVESFLEDMLIIYPLLGVAAFEVVQQRKEAVQAAGNLYWKGNDTLATGHEIPEGFIVLKDSIARIEETASLHEYVRSMSVLRK